LALSLWRELELDRFWGGRLPGIGSMAGERCSSQTSRVGSPAQIRRSPGSPRATDPATITIDDPFVADAQSSDGLIDMCAAAGIAFIPWYPLAASASRGESRICVDPLERRRVPHARFSLVGTVFATRPNGTPIEP
jgi:hypothetical protein